MAREITTTVYTYDELTPEAQAKARDWLRGLRDSSDLEHVIEDADRMLAILGIAVDRRAVKLMNGSTRQDPAISWSVGYCQSDGAWLDRARYQFRPKAAAKIRAEAPEDRDLHAIADGLDALQRFHKGAYRATFTHDDRRGFVIVDSSTCHGETPDLDETDREFREIVLRLEHWIYRQLQTEIEYQDSDEQIAETIIANGYEFTANGKRA